MGAATYGDIPDNLHLPDWIRRAIEQRNPNLPAIAIYSELLRFDSIDRALATQWDYGEIAISEN